MIGPTTPLTDEQRALVEDNLRLVYYFVNRYVGANPKAYTYKDDLVQECALLMMRWAQQFDPKRCPKFGTWVGAFLPHVIRDRHRQIANGMAYMPGSADNTVHESLELDVAPVETVEDDTRALDVPKIVGTLTDRVRHLRATWTRAGRPRPVAEVEQDVADFVEYRTGEVTLESLVSRRAKRISREGLRRTFVEIEDALVRLHADIEAEAA